ncbi:hypothetical protein EIP86_009217 [Pleurotus ostreatoroseus]|nr:hypothetical protein EIP86_009217 [Pleurotus ostreatoroseus]
MLTALRASGVRSLLASPRSVTSPRVRVIPLKATGPRTRSIATSKILYRPTDSVAKAEEDDDTDVVPADEYSSLESDARDQTEHAVISAFDLFSIGVGPSSSHTVGPMRAGKIFINDLLELDLLDKTKSLMLGGRHHIKYDMEQDMVWRWDQVLKTHPNGMRFSVFDEDGDLLATNEYFR